MPAAVESVRQWTFRPMRNGKPVVTAIAVVDVPFGCRAAAARLPQIQVRLSLPRELKVDRLQDKLRADRVRLEIQNREQTNLRVPGE